MSNIRFEPNKKGGIEPWYCPPGAIRRSDKIYLGYIGKRVLNKIGTGPDATEQIRQIVLEKLKEKGIDASA